MEKRERRHQPLLAVLQRAEPTFVDVALADVQEIEIAEQAAFRLAGRARRIEQRALRRIAGRRRSGRVEPAERSDVHDQGYLAMRQHVVELGPVVIRIHRNHRGTE